MDEMIEEFIIEAEELFSDAEDSLIRLEGGADFQENYNNIFRAFHSIKGSAGMLGLENLEKHMHHMESLFQKMKSSSSIPKAMVDYLLDGNDNGRKVLMGENISFEYKSKEDFYTEKKEKPKAELKVVTKEASESVITNDEKFLKVKMILGADFLSLQNEIQAIAGIEVVSGENFDLLVIDESSARNLKGIDEKKTILAHMNSKIMISLIKDKLKLVKYKTAFSKCLKLLVQNYADYDNYLKSIGDIELQKYLRSELKELLDTHKNLGQKS